MGFLRPVRIIGLPGYNTAQLAGGVVRQAKVNLDGHKRVKGCFRQTAATAPAAGFPRVRQSADGGATWDITDPIPQDLSQLPEVVFRFDIELSLPYVAVEWTNGAAPTTLKANVWAQPT